MRVVPGPTALLGLLLVVSFATGGLRAELHPNERCTIVDNSACQGQSREYCGVLTQVCIRCPGQPLKTCQVLQSYDCQDGQALICPNKETGQCLPDPLNPGTKICANWQADGSCDPALTCQ